MLHRQHDASLIRRHAGNRGIDTYIRSNAKVFLPEEIGLPPHPGGFWVEAYIYVPRNADEATSRTVIA